jgi:hypothetical protein
MKTRPLVLILAAAGICAICLAQPATQPTTRPASAGPPKPNVVPLTWEFEFEYDRLRSIALRLPDKPKPQLFWYVRYTVINKTGEDHVFVPEFVLYTDTGQVIRAGSQTPTSVFFAVKKRHSDPLLKTQTSITGKILHGEDNARNGVAIWPDFDPNAGAVDLFIGGLSGETKSIRLPKPIQSVTVDFRGDRKTVTKTHVLLAKTLHVRYGVPGEAAQRSHAIPKLVKKEWVLR